MLKDYSELTEVHKDMLQELGNIGTGNAITALSQLTNHQIQMELPKIRLVDYDKLGDMIYENHSNASGVLLKVHSDLECSVTFILNEVFTQVIAQELTGMPLESVYKMDEMQKSAICEVGNIMCNSYLNALASVLDVSLEVSVPFLKVGECKKILNESFEDFHDQKKELLLIENVFFYMEYKVISQIILYPKFESLQMILQKLEY